MPWHLGERGPPCRVGEHAGRAQRAGQRGRPAGGPWCGARPVLHRMSTVVVTGNTRQLQALCLQLLAAARTVGIARPDAYRKRGGPVEDPDSRGPIDLVAGLGKDIGEYIRQQRSHAQISLRQLSKLAGVVQSVPQPDRARPAQAERGDPAADRQGAAYLRGGAVRPGRHPGRAGRWTWWRTRTPPRRCRTPTGWPRRTGCGASTTGPWSR